VNSAEPENAEIVCLGNRASDVVVATVVVLGNRQSRTRPDGVDLLLEPVENTHRAAEVLCHPGILRVGWIPETAWALHDGLNLSVG